MIGEYTPDEREDSCHKGNHHDAGGENYRENMMNSIGVWGETHMGLAR